MSEQTYLDTLIDTLEAGGDPQPPTPESNTTDLNAGLVEARDRYRTERDAAREQVARLQRAEVERLASASLSHPEDLFSLSGNTVADYLDDNGNVDAAKVEADVAELIRERPGLRPLARPSDPTQGLGSTTPRRDPTWSSLLN